MTSLLDHAYSNLFLLKQPLKNILESLKKILAAAHKLPLVFLNLATSLMKSAGSRLAHLGKSLSDSYQFYHSLYAHRKASRQLSVGRNGMVACCGRLLAIRFESGVIYDMIKSLVLLFSVVLLAQPAHAALVLSTSPGSLVVNSGIQVINIHIRQTSNESLLAFSADFFITGPSVALIDTPAGNFGLAGMVGFNNLATGSFENVSNVAALSLDFNLAETVNSSAQGSLLAQLRVDTSSLVIGQYTVHLANGFAVSSGGSLVAVSGGGGFAAVPEPSSLLMVGLCAAGALTRFRKLRNHSGAMFAVPTGIQ